MLVIQLLKEVSLLRLCSKLGLENERLRERETFPHKRKLVHFEEVSVMNTLPGEAGPAELLPN